MHGKDISTQRCPQHELSFLTLQKSANTSRFPHNKHCKFQSHQIANFLSLARGSHLIGIQDDFPNHGLGPWPRPRGPAYGAFIPCPVPKHLDPKIGVRHNVWIFSDVANPLLPPLERPLSAVKTSPTVLDARANFTQIFWCFPRFCHLVRSIKSRRDRLVNSTIL